MTHLPPQPARLRGRGLPRLRLPSCPVVQNPYLALTDGFNRGRLRAILSSGQAVVAHRLAVMSKDGDWILRESEAALAHVLAVLAGHGAHYRFGAPLDVRWMAGGWSSHLEYQASGLRIRTDFVTRPPRLDAGQLAAVWAEAERTGDSVLGIVPLARLKLTNRERDYAVVGELARRMQQPADQLRFSRSARDLMELARRHPELTRTLSADRPVLARVAEGRDVLEAELDHERRLMMRANEARLASYQRASAAWAAVWKDVQREIEGRALGEAHAIVVQRAVGVLPFTAEALDG